MPAKSKIQLSIHKIKVYSEDNGADSLHIWWLMIGVYLLQELIKNGSNCNYVRKFYSTVVVVLFAKYQRDQAMSKCKNKALINSGNKMSYVA